MKNENDIKENYTNYENVKDEQPNKQIAIFQSL